MPLLSSFVDVIPWLTCSNHQWIMNLLVIYAAVKQLFCTTEITSALFSSEQPSDGSSNSSFGKLQEGFQATEEKLRLVESRSQRWRELESLQR